MSWSSQSDRRLVVYPHYITANKTVAEGRRIPKDRACEHPNVLEMHECCQALGIPCTIEDKHYPRDFFIRCRLRVQIESPEGKSYHEDVVDRRSLLLKLSEMVAKLPDRAKKNPLLAEALKGGAGGGGAAAASSSAAQSAETSAKKDGKAKKRK